MLDKTIEFIGKDIRIVECTNKNSNHIQGKIIDETKNTFILKDKWNHLKVIAKESIQKMELRLDSEKVYLISGQNLKVRPEYRVKNIGGIISYG